MPYLTSFFNRPAFLIACFLNVFINFAALAPLQAQEVNETLPRFQPVEDIFARFLTADTTVAANSTTTIGLEFNLPDGWHVYWQNPGDSGLPPRINVAGDGVTSGAVQYTVPKRFVAFEVVGYGYKDKALFTVPVSIGDVAGGVLTATAKSDFLMCKDICIPGSFSQELSWNVGANAEKNAAALAQFKQYKTAQALPAVASVQAVSGGYNLTVAGVDIVGFIPAENGMIDDTILPEASNGGLFLTADPWVPEAPTVLSGLIFAQDGAVYELSATSIQASAGESQSSSALWVIVASAFLAGLILNLMPCVLPILALKVLAFTRAENKPHAGSYTLGVLVGFWAVAAAVIAFQQAGSTVGWGFHLQNSTFVAALAGLMLAVALNMLSVFYLPTPKFMAQKRYGDGNGAAFMTGLLAVVVATPCTVPFMGGAVAYALTQGGAISFVIFTALGLGLAAPYAVLAYVPAARRMLPKPGAWMETLKHILAFPLLATALWLSWVFTGLTTHDAGFLLLALLLVWALLLWLFGLAQQKCSGWRWVWIVLGVVMTAYLLSAFQPSKQTWQPWSDTAVSEAISNGQSVFVDVTADWCVTCKVTELTVLNRKSAQAFFAENDIALFKADWTQEDPKITQYLASFERVGVPLYVVYHNGEIKVLGQLPTLSEIKAAYQ